MFGVAVRVFAPARLHMGFASTGWLMAPWSGIGLAVVEPATVVEAELADGQGVRVYGPRNDEAGEVARLVAGRLGLDGGVIVRVLEAPPSHVGLGSGTQLYLSVLEAVSRLAGVEPPLEVLVEAGLVGSFSWVGVAAFRTGGFILDLGEAASRMRRYVSLRFPEDWFVVHARPPGRQGHPRRGEAEKLRGLKYSVETEQRLVELLMKKILPGVLDHDLELFGRGLSEYQRLVGSAFSTYQQGVFNPDSAPIVSAMEEAGLLGVGQSSWGPTVYGFTESRRVAEEAARLLAQERGWTVTVTVANNSGARVVENSA
jgi:beta-ribofuranosylaminobenzene 5'-phosphate synthase